MENENLEIKKYILTYGGLLGGISIVFGLMLFFLDMHYQQETSVTVVNVIAIERLHAYTLHGLERLRSEAWGRDEDGLSLCTRLTLFQGRAKACSDRATPSCRRFDTLQ